MTRLQNLERAIAVVRDLGGVRAVKPQIAGLSADKLRWLARGGRPFLRPARDMELSAIRFVRAELQFSPSSPRASLRRALAEGVRVAVLLRFTAQQGVRLRPLTAKYLAHKIRRGLDRRIGIATARLLDELRAAKWIAR